MYKNLPVQTFLKMTFTTPVKPQISKFQAEKSWKVGLNELGRLHTHERLLSEPRRSYILAAKTTASPFKKCENH
jgi:hypothetical protein